MITRITLKDKQVRITRGTTETRLEAHKCELGTLAREALGTIGSGPNNTPPLNRVDETTDTRRKSKKFWKTENIL